MTYINLNIYMLLIKNIQIIMKIIYSNIFNNLLHHQLHVVFLEDSA